MKYLPQLLIAVGRLSPPSRGAWIEIVCRLDVATADSSPPSRGAWIEIVAVAKEVVGAVVAPLAGGVD